MGTKGGGIGDKKREMGKNRLPWEKITDEQSIIQVHHTGERCVGVRNETLQPPLINRTNLKKMADTRRGLKETRGQTAKQEIIGKLVLWDVWGG